MLSDDIRAALFSRAEFGAKADGERVHFRCPRHEDKNPSAWMGGGAWGCFSCNFQESITTLAEALGVPLGNGSGAKPADVTFDYVDEQGDLLFQVVRKYPKEFRQRRPDGHGGWEWKTKGVRRVLYRLPEIIAAVERGHTVYIVEGEKHADRLAKAGLAATTNAGGAGKWSDEYSEALRGAHVVILPDNDEPGQLHGSAIAHSLWGKAADVRVVRLPNLPQKGDVLDWLEAGGTIPDLEELSFDAPEWQPGFADAPSAATEQPQPQQHRGGFPAPISIRDLLAQPEPEDTFIFEPFLPADANVILAAYPKCFKTGFLLSLSLAAVAGRRFLNMFPVPRRHRVGLVLMEDRAHRVRRRLDRLSKGLDRPLELGALDGSLWLWFRPPLLLGHASVMQELARYVADRELDLLIVDSWSYVSQGNPNDAEVVTPQLMALSALRDHAPGLTIILVHHARKAGRESNTDDERITDVLRNSSAFGAWYDSGILLSRQNENSPVSVRMELRDLPAPSPFTFTLEDEFPAGPEYGFRPDGWLRIHASKEHPALSMRRARAESLAPAVLDAIRANPGLSKRDIRARLGKRAADVDAAIDLLRSERKVTNHGDEKKGLFYAA